jgi:hypothetical protein
MPDWDELPNQSPAITPFGRSPKILVPQRQPTRLVPQANASQDINDTRAAFDAILEADGIYVLVQRMNLKIHCTQCWNEVLGEGDLDCPYCLGRGYLSILERHLARRQSSDNAHKQQLLVQGPIGGEIVDAIFWYFSWATNISVEDMVYEVTWADQAFTTPQRLLTAYRVNYSDPFRGSGGRIQYWRAAGMSRPIDRTTVGDHIRRIGTGNFGIPNDGIVRYTSMYRS